MNQENIIPFYNEYKLFLILICIISDSETVAGIYISFDSIFSANKSQSNIRFQLRCANKIKAVFK